MEKTPMTRGEAEAVASVLRAIDRSVKIVYGGRDVGWTVVSAI